MLFRLPFALTWVSLATAFTTHLLKERVPEPRRWQRLDAAPREHVIPLKLALPHSRFNELEDHLLAISDPLHLRYGAHLSKEEVQALMKPHQESVDAVDAWLEELGFGETDVERSPALDWVMVKVPVSIAEKMLDTVWRNVSYLHSH